jgi:ribonuclease E
MSKELCISSTPHETRLAIVEDDQLTEIYYERENEYTLAGSIYKGRVTRVLPGMQSAFVDIGLERDAFLYVTDFLEEQGESADFEKPQQGGGRDRQPREAREGGRGPRPAREPEGKISVEPAEGEDISPRSASPDAALQEEFDDGTRRFRGRRGRRRGGLRGAPREGATPSPAPSAAPSLDENFHDEPEAPFEAVAGFPISAQAEEPSTPESFASTAAHARSSRRDNARRDGRNEGRGEGRHESRSEGRYESAPSGPAIVLPGESLSKYGQKAPVFSIEIEAVDRSDEKPLPVYTTAAPSTLVNEDALAWDGVSSALPGESLSKHRNRPAATAAAPQFVQEYRNVADFTAPVAAETSHDEASASHSAPIEILHAVQTADGVSFEEVQSHSEAPAIAPQETKHEEAFTAQHPAPLIEEEVEEEVLAAPHVEAEFEPEHASASYRVDPVAPEFRLATPVEELPVADEAHAVPVTNPVPNEEEKWDWLEGSQAQTETHAPADELEIHGSFQAEAAPQTEPAAQLQSNASHEGAEEGFYPESNPLELLHAFAPGTGLLEEEVIDEEEYDFTPLHAHADDHDLEEIEEETLDSALVGSQLGDFVRDEHITRRVMGDPETDTGDDGDDFDEDEAISEEETSEDGLAEEELTDPEFAEASGELTNGHAEARIVPNGHAEAGTVPAPRRDENRRREGGRDNGRGGRRNNGQRGRSGGHRHSAQTSDLPIISDLLKQGQEVLIQIAKEPIAKKGARITSHIALPGRFLVFMPTVNHVGVSRKISSDEERLRLKRILTSEKGTAPGGFIVRTAADGASEEELRADLRFLISLWTEIKSRSDNGKAPALIYHDLNLVERVLRDQVSDNFSTIWVDSEVEYERIVRFLNRFEPSLVRRVKLYTKETPLFEQFGIQEEISKALKSKVWLKSGGSIVINQTEALVAIDINTGKYVGKTARLEDTIVKTNLDAIPEIVRQIRLRDLGGIIIIDFIDMDERKNRNKVMQALEDELKSDRAPSKVLQFNDFGLVAITRKRVKQSLERTLSTQCNICAGTGMVKSPVTVCNEIYTELRKMMKHFERGDVLLRVNPEIVKTLKENNGKWLTELEEMIGRTILVKSDPALHPEQFDIH